jgi:hypothetical protein
VRGITISRLRQIADYMESLGRRTGIARIVGSGGGVVAGSLTVAGGVLTLLTAGAAAPVLVRSFFVLSFLKCLKIFLKPCCC